MKFKQILLALLILSLSSCVEEYINSTVEIEDVAKSESNFTFNGDGDKSQPDTLCCHNLSLEYSVISSTTKCCTYQVRFENNSTCLHFLQTPKGVKATIPSGESGEITWTVCDHKGTGAPQTSILYLYFVAVDNSHIICETISLSSDCLECPFTYSQGVNVGCSLAEEATEQSGGNCCDISCSSAYLNTIEDYQYDCPEYVEGVIDGWAACICQEVIDNPGSGGGPVLCGGVPSPAPHECECVNNMWECQ